MFTQIKPIKFAITTVWAINFVYISDWMNIFFGFIVVVIVVLLFIKMLMIKNVLFIFITNIDFRTRKYQMKPNLKKKIGDEIVRIGRQKKSNNINVKY